MDETLFYQIDAYLQQQLTEQERTDFEAKMAEDAALRDQVAEQQRTIELIEWEGARAVLQEVMQEKLSERPGVRRPVWRRLAPIMAIAAGVLVLLLINIFRPKAGPNELFQRYFSPAQGLPSLLGATDNPAFEEGMISYKRAEYAEALRYWDTLAGATDNDTIAFYTGLSELALGNAEMAISELDRSFSPQFSEDAKWYRSLAHLKLGELEKARRLWEELRETPKYGVQATELLGSSVEL